MIASAEQAWRLWRREAGLHLCGSYVAFVAGYLQGRADADARPTTGTTNDMDQHEQSGYNVTGFTPQKWGRRCANSPTPDDRGGVPRP